MSRFCATSVMWMDDGGGIAIIIFQLCWASVAKLGVQCKTLLQSSSGAAMVLWSGRFLLLVPVWWLGAASRATGIAGGTNCCVVAIPSFWAGIGATCPGELPVAKYLYRVLVARLGVRSNDAHSQSSANADSCMDWACLFLFWVWWPLAASSATEIAGGPNCFVAIHPLWAEWAGPVLLTFQMQTMAYKDELPEANKDIQGNQVGERAGSDNSQKSSWLDDFRSGDVLSRFPSRRLHRFLPGDYSIEVLSNGMFRSVCDRCIV